MIYYNQIPSLYLEKSLYSYVNIPFQYSAPWQLQVIGFLANNDDLTSFSSSNAVIDSGTSLFYLNTNLFQQIKSKYLNNCSYIQAEGMFLCPCSVEVPSFSFVFPGVQVYLPSSAYVKNVSQGVCGVFISSIAT